MEVPDPDPTMRSAPLVLLLVAVTVFSGCMTPTQHMGTSSGTADGEGAVDIRNAQYSPAILEVTPGTTVTWTNRDPYAHTVTPLDPVAWGSAGSGDEPATWIKPGATYEHTFPTAGTFLYRCIPHSSKAADGSYVGQVGRIVVGA